MQNSENENQDQEASQGKKELDLVDEIMQMYNERKATEALTQKEANESADQKAEINLVKNETREMENVIEEVKEKTVVEQTTVPKTKEKGKKENNEVEKMNQEVEKSKDPYDDFMKSLEGKDFNTLPLSEILSTSEKLLKVLDMKKANTFFINIKEVTEKLFNSQKEKAKAAYIEDSGTDEGFAFSASKEIGLINTNFKSFKQNRKTLYEAQNKERENNLKIKKSLIEELKLLMESVGEKGNLDAVKVVQQKMERYR